MESSQAQGNVSIETFVSGWEAFAIRNLGWKPVETMKNEPTPTPVESPRCGDCQHFEHEPGACKNCNCGESAIVGRGPGYEQTIANATRTGNTQGMGGRRGWAPPSD